MLYEIPMHVIPQKSLLFGVKINDGGDANNREAVWLQEKRAYMGESGNVTLQCLSRRLLKQSNSLATGKCPGLTSCRLFLSELLKIAHRTSAKCSIGTFSEPAIHLVCMAPCKNCNFSAILYCLTKQINCMPTYHLLKRMASTLALWKQ